ncbi:hypothetical protein [Pseudomonas aeruginosa]|uniref:hypothetical protein n=1 Tax=Pseudomonas aeruginosa TaxID=287 RepID=UPI000EAF49B7|nr:hypothetical protein [Pseudomonas aeruginosa]MCT4938882.1 hypothetical protein [Pseudomonas aeruginosa]NNB82307.1 hypothetical protein [Pseudomonas aeruginosa]RUB23782.1 hypothetical protein IPC1432_28880 [Pseudomonas aeruginosa]
MAKKVKLGDVLQILTSQGVAYAQVTHKHPEFGYLIRVFSGFYDAQPEDFSAVVSSPVQFSAFFVVQSAVNQGLLSVVANTPVPVSLQVFPTFRSRNGGPGGSIWLWSGGDAVRLERCLLPEELTYPTEGIISAPLLVERIENNYRAETHEVW